ncbi:MFS transporter [Streptomyces litchfieldiae]|uniref:MFS transporter n=1 Tax=Streptomyces litchfieldiae TaxID=3075543 RepID=A0ABU2MYS3_9ACTN|nr:MFS transporter [Streptomyces sp. DSM 44938]MDT0346423.1 MFS transporter [Streptomyces sp. DSM 44938]
MAVPTEKTTEEPGERELKDLAERPEAAADAPDPKRWVALSVILFAAFMDLLDVTIVNVAVPSIQGDLGASYSAVAWITAGYALSFATLLITGGRLGDIYGRRRVLLIGMAGFTVASLLCGIADSPGMLVAARVVQGAMAALMVPQVLSIIHVTFPAEERGKVFGMFGGIGGLAVILGPVLGGVFVEADLFGWSWRPIFLVNLPVGIATFIAALYFVRESKDPDAPRLDVVGVVLAAASVLMLVYPLTQGRELGWPAWSFVMMAGSLVLLGCFISYERRLIARGGSPLIALDMFTARSFAGGFSVNLVYSVAYGTFFLTWTLYMQTGLGWSAMRAGLTALPMFIGFILAAGMAVQFLTPRFGRRVLFAGGGLLILGGLALIWASDRYGLGIDSVEMSVPIFVFGLGMGCVVAPVLDFALTDVPHKVAGSASGVLNTSGQLGGAIGIALVAVLFLAALPGQSGKGIDSVEARVHQELTVAGVADEDVRNGIVAGYRLCTEDRMAEVDPSVVPESCRTAPDGVTPEQAEVVAGVLADNAGDAQAETFARAFRVGMFYVLGLFALMTLLMTALPKFAKPQQEPAL